MIVVTGAPCSGKSTYIATNATAGDVIIDMDRIALALTTDDTPHHGYDEHVRFVARQARHAAINAALHAHQVTGCRVWIIDTFPSRTRWRKAGARIEVMDPGIEVCLQRASEQRPEWVQQIIGDWYAKYQPAADGF